MQRECGLDEIPDAHLVALRGFIEDDVARIQAWRRAGICRLEWGRLRGEVVQLAEFDQEIARRESARRE